MLNLSLLGFDVRLADPAELQSVMDETIRAQGQSVLAYLNLHAFCLGQSRPWFRRFMAEAERVYCDGEAVCWAARFLNQPIPQKNSLTRWIWSMAEHCSLRGYRVFLLGGKPGVAEKAAQKLQAAYPSLTVAGFHHGYFKSGDQPALLDRLRQARPDVLVISFGMPHQEKWIEENRSKLPPMVFIPGGGVLDYVSGRLGKAPEWMIQMHLEWLFRIWEEPGRLAGRYLREIPWLAWLLLREKIRQGKKERAI